MTVRLEKVVAHGRPFTAFIGSFGDMVEEQGDEFDIGFRLTPELIIQIRREYPSFFPNILRAWELDYNRQTASRDHCYDLQTGAPATFSDLSTDKVVYVNGPTDRLTGDFKRVVSLDPGEYALIVKVPS